MSTQSEAQLENEMIAQLTGLGYDRVVVEDEASLLLNLRGKLEEFNGTVFSDREFNQILNHLSKGNVFAKSKTLRDRLNLTRDDETHFYVRFLNTEVPELNHFQVTHQVTVKGRFENRYDVTLLVNGLPLVQIELKRRGLELKEAFNQINRYQKHSFWACHGLFQYVQLFVISNGVNTKYLANNELQSAKQCFYWSDVNNRNITNLSKFTEAFLNTQHLATMISHYIVQNETHKIMMVLRPYQYYATEAIINHVKSGKDNGYIWHTTGSGKTLTSFKASQILMNQPEIKKVVFVVDRKDLDYQTIKEFDSFKKDSVSGTKDTGSLLKQLKDDTKLVVTTVQKLNNAIGEKNAKSIEALRNERMVFIFDECHRSQFGDTHKRITQFFENTQLFGFTGTPIFAQNASKNDLGKRTTKDLFGECLHKYVITDAIKDQNVLPFKIEYFGRYKNTSDMFMDIDVEEINTQEVMESEERLGKVVDFVIANHDAKTHNREYSAMFAVSNIDSLIKYYDLFQKKKNEGLHDLRIATIFTYGANEPDKDANDSLPADESGDDLDGDVSSDSALAKLSSHSRDKLEGFIGDYNKQYGVSFTTKDSKEFENYFKDISKRLKEREKKDFKDKDRLDILLVVNMFLTGFDAKKLNTLYVDKNLKYHGLIQAYSRTNRILGEQKSQGNIVCFRNLKEATDDAIGLFSNKEAKEVILLPDYDKVKEKFDEAFDKLKAVAPEVESVTDLLGEERQLKFVQSFRELMRFLNVLKSYSNFDWESVGISEQEFADYKSKYLDLYEANKPKEKVSILKDIDFELELIHRDEINVSYIYRLLAQIKDAKAPEAKNQVKDLLDLLAGDVELRSKRELIEKFIEENLPKIDNPDNIPEEFEKYWEDEKIQALHKICEEEGVKQQQFAALVEAYVFSGQDPVRKEVIDCLENKPSILQSRTIAQKIIDKMKHYVEVFVQGMTA